MSASYPNNIRTFTTKKNRIDDVEASDVNDLQNEVTALESVLGTVPQLFKTPPAGPTVDYGTVGSRLDAAQHGDMLPIVELYTPKWNLKSGSQSYSSYTKRNDNFVSYNGSDITIKATGWWFVSTRISWPYNPNGYRWMTMQQNSETIGTVDRPAVISGTKRDANLSIVWQGLAHAGDRFRVAHYQNSGSTLQAYSLWLAASMLKTYDPNAF